MRDGVEKSFVSDRSDTKFSTPSFRRISVFTGSAPPPFPHNLFLFLRKGAVI